MRWVVGDRAITGQDRREGRQPRTLRHAFQMAEVAVPRQTFADIPSLITRLRASPAPA
jgi:hypothetical protein